MPIKQFICKESDINMDSMFPPSVGVIVNVPKSKESNMRRFILRRSEDVSGTSGTGVVAEGVEFSNGQVAIHWISQLESVNIYANVKVLDTLHGHDNRTVIEWID